MRVRPPQGWQAVSWELAIVTIGVLLALAAQQWAEARAWGAKAGAARQALRGELADHHEYAVEWRVVAPCINAQLESLEQRLLAGGSKLDPAPLFSEYYGEAPLSYAIRTPNRPYDDSVWQATNGDGISGFLYRDERLELGAHYRQVTTMKNQNDAVRELASRLSVLTKSLDLDPGVRVSLLQQTAEIRGHNRWMNIIAGQLVHHITQLRMSAPRARFEASIARSGTIKFCRSQGLPMLTLSKALVPAP